tara:strand:+ start:128 stop:1516 length:1389 start_codon:yes stop_codon:yes gene_type:complete
MASTFSNLGLELQTTGENANTWGDKTNVNLELIDERLSAIGTITDTSSFTMPAPSNATKSVNNGAATLKFTGSASAEVVVTMPAKTLLYNVINSTGQSLKFKCSTETTTATIKNGQNGTIHSDGSANVYLISTVANDFDDDVTIKTGDGALLTLQTSDTDVTDGEVLGALQFQAPDEAGGTDATTVAASIVAEADDTFAADSNKTDFVFKLGSSEAATEKMRLRHEGHLNIVTDGAFLNFGADLDVQLSHVHNVGLLLNSTRRLHFEDDTNLDQYIGSGGSGVLEIASPTEIDITATTIDINGAVVCDSVITATGFTIGSAAITEAELEYLDQVTPGTVAASHAVVVDSNKDITGFRNIANTGTITADGNITAFSDERLKSDIKTIDNALDKVMKMRGVSYTKQAERGIGVIAQEVEKIIPEVVHDGEYKSVAYGNMVGVLIEAIKDLKQELDEHKEGCNCK